MTTGERMKARRKELCLSAEFIADKLGISPATVYRYEKGDIEKMPGKILEPIANVLKTTPAYLMGWDETPAQKGRNLVELDLAEAQLVADYRDASEEIREEAAGMLSRSADRNRKERKKAR